MATRFNPPPGWPTPPSGWVPPAGWNPDPEWPPAPAGWILWVEAEDSTDVVMQTEEAETNVSDNSGVSAIDSVESLLETIANLESQLANQSRQLTGSGIELNDQAVLQEMGIYRYNHPLEDAASYREQLKTLESEMDDYVKKGKTVLAADMFTFDGSLARGRKLVSDLSKLMLRAYNSEADNCVRSLKSGNFVTAKKRLEASVQAIEKLGSIIEMRINPDFHALRIRELELVADYQMKLQEEKERAREQRELLREQRKVESELANERERLDKERQHYISAIGALEDSDDASALSELKSRLDEIEKAIEDNDYRAANVRAGYVYVISNVGAFGHNIVKIGLTRRLEPRDRIQELSSASVPFPFDIHALFFSEDAVTLENELHKHFASKRVNWVNERREFFFVDPVDVREVLIEKVGGLLEFTELPNASEYLQSKKYWPES